MRFICALKKMQTCKVFQRKISVKLVSAYFYSLISLLILSGCGFQLNTNEPQLILNAKSISFKEVQNQTFSPGIEHKVKQKLNALFQANGNIRLASPRYSDLNLSINIQNVNQSVSDYSVQTVNYYKHFFTIKAQIKVEDSRTQKRQTQTENKKALSFSISGSKEVQSTDKTLSSFAINKATQEAAENLVQQIYNRLTSNF